MICSKCMASYPMGFKECPDCGASSKFAVLESEISDVEVDVAADTEEIGSDSKVPELKITSLTDENMFMEGFVIPESRPPEEPDPQKPSKRRSRKTKKVPVEDIVPLVEENTYANSDTEEATVEEPITVEQQSDETPSVEIVSEVEEGEEVKVEKTPEPKSDKRTPQTSSLFASFAAEAAQSLGAESLPKVDTTKANDMADMFQECSNIQSLETEENNTPEMLGLKGVETEKEKPDTVSDDEAKMAEIKPESKKSVSRDKSKQKSEKTKEISRNITIASVFGFLSIFIPIMFIPSNVYLNKIPKDTDIKGIRIFKTVLNVLFYINLFGLVLGVISLTKALALNYQSLFAEDFAPLTGEFGKIAPLAIIRGFDFWSSLFSAETGVWIKGVLDTYFSDFISELSQLKNGFDIKIVFSLFGKIGIPLIVTLSSVGITGKIVYSQKIRTLEKKLENVYRMGNYSGETVRAIKDKKRDLTFKKKSFIKIIIVLVILTFILAEGYPIISKILPLLDFIKEDIQNTK